MKRFSLVLAAAIHTAYVAAVGIPLMNHDDVVWYGDITVGSSAQTFTVAFDTGSADLIIPGRYCDSSCDGHARYDPSSSNASQNPPQTFTLTFGDGETVSGEQFTDTVSIGGLTAVKQTVGVATHYSSGLGRS